MTSVGKLIHVDHSFFKYNCGASLPTKEQHKNSIFKRAFWEHQGKPSSFRASTKPRCKCACMRGLQQGINVFASSLLVQIL